MNTEHCPRCHYARPADYEPGDACYHCGYYEPAEEDTTNTLLNDTLVAESTAELEGLLSSGSDTLPDFPSGGEGDFSGGGSSDNF